MNTYIRNIKSPKADENKTYYQLADMVTAIY